MEFDNAFDVPLPPAQAWAILMDIPRIAPCMPGAELTEIVDPQNYKGKISVRTRSGGARFRRPRGV